ncbi:hypothetical protein AQJ66_17490 [Streptomyces bungoensis]|uniref:Uncharacterized protein n=1 Tax=Streptomyces bungoensis TaxID=285568 RepID=A0A101T1A3_9ACTN|nr:DUF5819 family protein [Streptomyces bungoensis]KUN83952.1 hypothetical protein AQJ66_17490 [Streptomyces bungoensis]
MDAYDEDSHARGGPDGAKGASHPDRDPEGDAGTGPGSGPKGGVSSGSGSGPEPGAGSGQEERAGSGGPRPGSGAEREPLAAAPDAPAADAADAVDVRDAGPPDQAPLPSPRTGVAALSPRYQTVAALALAVVAVAACVHLAMVFLSVAPANTVTKQHGRAIEDWVYPEFEQNWKLFAPNPLQQNIAVQARAEVRMKDGGVRTTGWTDLSARDGAAIDGNLVPSHTQQNELRRAWDFFVATHTADNRPVALRGSLSEQYVRRIVVMRLYRDDPTSREGVIQRVQVRSSTTNVQPPKWSPERVSDKPVYRLLPWWTVSSDEAAGGVR